MIKRWGVVLFASLVVFGNVELRAGCIDNKVWEGILKANVDKDGFLDYDSVRINKGGDLYQYISFVEAVDLKSCKEIEKQAFWINAYNANMVKLVLARSSMKKVSDDFALFGEKFKVARMNLSLNEIEHRVLRSCPKNGGPIEGVSLSEIDPRIHFALVWGAISSPRLMNKAYNPANLDEMLSFVTVNFINDPKYIRIENDTLVMSPIFRWYASDFDKKGGVVSFVSSLLDPATRQDAAAIKAKLLTDFPDKVRFHFDWTVNNVKITSPLEPGHLPQAPAPTVHQVIQPYSSHTSGKKR